MHQNKNLLIKWTLIYQITVYSSAHYVFSICDTKINKDFIHLKAELEIIVPNIKLLWDARLYCKHYTYYFI